MTKLEKQWRIQKGSDRRFRSGHPWVYSNELVESPKSGGIVPGEVIKLVDSSGKFLARGFGNPHSLIAFRELSRDPEVIDPASDVYLGSVLKAAWELRLRLGFRNFSYRLCFGEADGLPGLVIDRFLLVNGKQAFSIQAHTAGAQALLMKVPALLEKYSIEMSGISWDHTALILRNDLGVRKLEGLKEEEPRVIKEFAGMSQGESENELRGALIQVRSVLDLREQGLTFQVDLVEGQKTGFFLDQFSNIQTAALSFRNFFKGSEGKHRIKILDLCSYVGQWSVQLSHLFLSQGHEVEVVAVDASQKALEFAERNVMGLLGEKNTSEIRFQAVRGDVLRDLSNFEAGSFDLVCSDPPAFIKGKKDLHAGTHAYFKLATDAIRLTRRGGGIISCSCSALLTEESFQSVLSKAAQRNHVKVKWVGRGGQSPDHPVLTEFPEGRYLKGWMGVLLPSV